MLTVDQLPSRSLNIEGEEYLYFSGTAYLGIGKNEEFQSHLQEGLKKYGTNYSSSRISNLQLAIFEEAEAYLAFLTGAEAALTVSSGFLAGQIVVRLLQGEGKFFYAPKTHPALWIELNHFFREDFATWTQKVGELVKATPEDNIIILSNSLDPLLVQQYDFDWIEHLPTNKIITLLVDDSHGLGVTGKEGGGIFSELRKFAHIRPIVISSLGKAFGIPGGVILADRVAIESFKKSPFFGGSSPVIPAYLHTFLRSGNIYKEERKKLFDNIELFTNLIKGFQLFDAFPAYPVFYTKANSLATYLQHRNILISSFPYPSPEDELITRVVLNSLHTQEDIQKISFLISQFIQSQSGK